MRRVELHTGILGKNTHRQVRSGYYGTATTPFPPHCTPGCSRICLSPKRDHCACGRFRPADVFLSFEIVTKTGRKLLERIRQVEQ